MIAHYLHTAAEQQWSGTLRVRSRGEPCGTILLLEGRVAWAVSKVQRETLGSFLWRLGYLTATQLELARSLFKVHEGRKKLGAIIVECGFMSRAVLRRGLGLHIRAAITSLAHTPDVSVFMLEATPETSEPLLFEVHEVMPTNDLEQEPAFEGDEAWQFWHIKSGENDILAPLTRLPGCLGAGIFTGDGAILTAHVIDHAFEPMFLGTMLASVRETLVRVDAFSAMGRWRAAHLDCERGILWMRIAGEDHDLIVATLTRPDAPEADVRQALDAVFPDVQAWAEDNSSPRRFRTLLKRFLTEAEDDAQAAQAIAIAVRERLRQARELDLGEHLIDAYQRALDLLDRGELRPAIEILSSIDDANPD